jgi:hypothetical protein
VSKQKSTLDSLKPQVHASPGDSAAEKIVKSISSSNWQDNITVPMPKIYVPDENFIGKKVKIFMCEFHEDCSPAPGYKRKEVSLTGNCNCKLKGKEVTITGTKQTDRARFYRSICYTIADSKHLVHESEFSPESLDKEKVVKGYILEGDGGMFLSAGFNFLPKEAAIEGYLFNTGLVKAALKEKSISEKIKKAYPAQSAYDGTDKKITGKAISVEELRKIILVS